MNDRDRAHAEEPRLAGKAREPFRIVQIDPDAVDRLDMGGGGGGRDVRTRGRSDRRPRLLGAVEIHLAGEILGAEHEPDECGPTTWPAHRR